jgi:hypothetical protein
MGQRGCTGTVHGSQDAQIDAALVAAATCLALPIVSFALSVTLRGLDQYNIFGAFAALGGLVLRLAFLLAEPAGQRARQRVRTEFQAAKHSGANVFRAGGAKWVVIDGGNFRVSHAVNDRYVLGDPQTSYSLRRQTEIHALSQNNETIIAMAILAYVLGLAFISIGPSYILDGRFIFAGACALCCAFVVTIAIRSRRYEGRHG